MSREFIARSTKMPRSIGRLSASALSHHGLSSAVFITNIAESDFRYTQVFRHACQLGFEGIVSKRLGSPYVSGRSRHWIKSKNPQHPAVKREAEEDLGPVTLLLKRDSASRPSGDCRNFLLDSFR
jgi:hypothetical protein